MKVSANKGIIILSTTKATEFAKVQQVSNLIEKQLNVVGCEESTEEFFITLAYDSTEYTVRQIKDLSRSIAKSL